ncbi:MAG: nuclear transport factor 2 family protein [Microthrixaceae bacterium]
MPATDDFRLIEKLIYAYADQIDAGNFAGVARLFRHGRIQAAPGFLVRGEESVLKLYESSTRLYEDGTPRTRHVTTNVVVEFEGTTEPAQSASARSYFTVFQQTEELPLQAIIAGHYSDSFQRVDTEWCFDTREIFVDLTGDLSKHLLFELG